MAQKKTRGLTDDQELNEEFLNRDTRSLFKKFVDFAKVPANMAMILSVHAALAFTAPQFGDYVLVMALLFFAWGMARKESCPLKMPKQCGLPDVNQPHPGNGQPTPADGIFFLGNELKSGKEIWLTNDDCRQHFLVIGTTGAGKTETLIGFAANALLWGSGFLFCDGKGDVALFAKVYALARRFGREDDLLVLNFMTGNQDLGAAGGKLISNTMNPFANGSSDSLTQMVVSLMDDAGGDGAMWKGRATAMLTGVMRALTYLRDQGIVDLNVGEIRDFMSLRRIIDLSDTSKYPDLPANIRKSIKAYLSSLPGFQEDKGYKQAQTTLDQHGYLEMQFTKILGSLADVYGHIFKTAYGEVDMADVVLNRRILVIMLPALEKSGDEIANLGKIVVATLKGMMGGTLGSQLEGNWAEVVDNRPTNSPSPFITILDEVGYYTVEGMALMAAQARSLGFMLVYASQDIPAMKRLNEKEAASIIANTNTKIWMRLEEAEQSGKLAIEGAGKGLRAQVGGYQGESGNTGVGYRDDMSAKIESVDKITFTDLKAQNSGEMHVVHKDFVIRAKSFYADPASTLDKKKLKLRANHFIKVARPDLEELEGDLRAPEILEKLINPDAPTALRAEADRMLAAARGGASATDEIAIVAAALDQMSSAKRSPVEAACAAVAAVIEAQRANVAAFGKAVRGSAGLDAMADEDELEPVPLKAPGRDAPRGAFSHLRDQDAEPQRRPADGPAARARPPVPEDAFGGDAGPASRGLSVDEAMGMAAGQAPAGDARPRRKGGLLKKGVRHGVQIDDNEIVDMADNISANETIMRALAALDFDTATTKPEAVEEAIEEAIAPDDYLEGGDISAIMEDDIEMAIGDVDMSLSGVVSDEGEGDGETELATQFLESLLKDDD